MLDYLKRKIVEILATAAAAVLRQEKVVDAIFRQQRTRSSQNAVFMESMSQFLQDPEGQKLFWIKANVRPMTHDTHWAVLPNSIREARMQQATREAGRFVHRHIPHLEGTKSPYHTLKRALEAVTVSGLYLEFGVFSGATINYIADNVDKGTIIHGFDSFQGLPEAWGTSRKGTFNCDGTMPEVRDNVRLHPGWFDESIEPFLEKHRDEGLVAFLHADADLYSSTWTILSKLNNRIVSGTVIVFDEYMNYPYWREHEYKAFSEFIEQTGRHFEYIAYTDRGYSVAVKII